MAEEPVEVAGIRIATHARDHKMFAGKLDRKVLSAPQRASASWYSAAWRGDFRNWAEIRQWADGIARQLMPAMRPASGEVIL